MAESSSLHDLLQCSICLERFTQPKVLPCQHSFCLNCLRGITKDAKTLDCPQCRARHVVPEKGMSAFPDDRVINNLLGIVPESIPCSDCGRDLNLTKCQHCQEEVCADCRASHAKLLAEIETYLKWADGAFKTPETGSETSDWWETLLNQIVGEKKKVQDTFEDVIEKMKNRKKEITAFLIMLENRAQFLMDPSKSKALYRDVMNCKTSEALNEMKLQLTNTDDILWKIRGEECDFNIQYDFEFIDHFGHLRNGCPVLNMKHSGLQDKDESGGDTGLPLKEEASVPKRSNDWGSLLKLPANRERALLSRNVLPRNVDYQAKNTHMKVCVDQHVEAKIGKKLIPGFALYNKSSDDFYLISEGVVLVYPLGGGEGRKLSPVITDIARHVAISESGCKLVIAEGPVVTIVDLEASRNLDSAHLQIVSFRNISNAVQVCCHGNEFAVLDVDKKCVLTFSEDGKFIREFGADKLLEINENSRMCVDREGRIYVTNAPRVDRKESEDVYAACGQLECRKPRSVTVTMKWVIVVLSWEGIVEETEIDGWSKKYEYRFDSLRCPHNYNMRTENSVPSNGQIIRENMICGICVDADGYISLTMTGKNTINVYNPKRELHCTIGDPVKRPGEFKEPSGVNLMPDGRLIVCDTGNNRIQII